MFSFRGKKSDLERLRETEILLLQKATELEDAFDQISTQQVQINALKTCLETRIQECHALSQKLLSERETPHTESSNQGPEREKLLQEIHTLQQTELQTKAIIDQLNTSLLEKNQALEDLQRSIQTLKEEFNQKDEEYQNLREKYEFNIIEIQKLKAAIQDRETLCNQLRHEMEIEKIEHQKRIDLINEQNIFTQTNSFEAESEKRNGLQEQETVFQNQLKELGEKDTEKQQEILKFKDEIRSIELQNQDLQNQILQREAHFRTESDNLKEINLKQENYIIPNFLL
eukprot:TRINITY_DN1292_c0_g1_i1.p1 TRINITY_DN1292_c0_g1~~TRINITY_DN1292_c0_g1_i1.p1  ORF type:complete len:286 (+),score=87.47 TRINITY_DN1292_c0_g1_i1:40-897(+)